MNNWNWFKNSLLALTLSGTLAHADPAPPKAPPFVRPVIPGESWEITLSKNPRKNSGTEPTRILKHISGKRAKFIRHEEFQWSDRETDQWTIGRMVLRTSNDGKSLLPTKLSNNPENIERRLSQFSELTWVAPAHYKETVKEEGRLCHYYEFKETMFDQASENGEPARSSETVQYERRAWIDAETGFPVASENPDYRFVYTFSTFSPPVLLPPDTVRQAAIAAESSLAALFSNDHAKP